MMKDPFGELIAYPSPNRPGFWAYRRLPGGGLRETELTLTEWRRLHEEDLAKKNAEIDRLNEHPLNVAALELLRQAGSGPGGSGLRWIHALSLGSLILPGEDENESESLWSEFIWWTQSVAHMDTALATLEETGVTAHDLLSRVPRKAAEMILCELGMDPPSIEQCTEREHSGKDKTPTSGRRIWRYYDNWRTAEFDCRECGWHGLGSNLLTGETFDEVYELDCPVCHECVTPILYPTLGEARLNWDKLPDDERRTIEEREAFWANFNNRKLKSPSQLPDISEPVFVLTWDHIGEESVIKHGERVIFSEPALWEGYERFLEVIEILRARYGNAIRDLVPTDGSKMYLYGDKLSGPRTVEIARKRIFAGDSKG